MPRSRGLRPVQCQCTSPLCEKASLILDRTHESAEALLKAFDLARSQRGNPRGMTTDEEQDLLRAMLVMAAAGLDAMTKQLIRDTLPRAIELESRALNTFETFIARRLRDAVSSNEGNKFLAHVLSRSSPQAQLIEEYINYLTQGSLQSHTALFEIAATLGLWPDRIGITQDSLTPIFDTRNKIIHELDINLSAHMRRRNLRRRQDLVRNTNTLIEIGQKMLQAVDGILCRNPPTREAP